MGEGVSLLVAGLLTVGAAAGGFLSARARRPAAPAARPRRVSLALQPFPDGDGRVEECRVALSHAWGRGRFEVRVGERVVGRSAEFPVPSRRPLGERGQPGAAHARLLALLEAAGWHVAPGTARPWYARRLFRARREFGSPGVERGLVTALPGAGEARFLALRLDDYGNPTVLARSVPFERRAAGAIEPSEHAVTAHGALLEDLRARGWRASGTLGSWFTTTLARRRR